MKIGSAIKAWICLEMQLIPSTKCLQCSPLKDNPVMKTNRLILAITQRLIYSLVFKLKINLDHIRIACSEYGVDGTSEVVATETRTRNRPKLNNFRLSTSVGM